LSVGAALDGGLDQVGDDGDDRPGAAATIAAPSGEGVRLTGGGRGRSQGDEPAPRPAEMSTPPTAPSQVFFGLIVGGHLVFADREAREERAHVAELGDGDEPEARCSERPSAVIVPSGRGVRMRTRYWRRQGDVEQSRRGWRRWASTRTWRRCVRRATRMAGDDDGERRAGGWRAGAATSGSSECRAGKSPAIMSAGEDQAESRGMAWRPAGGGHQAVELMQRQHRR